MGSDWQTRQLGELADIYDGPHATPKKSESGPIFLGISNLSNGRLDLTNTEHVSNEDFDRWTRRITPREGDIVFSYETRLGEAALIPAGLRACLGRRMGLLRPNSAIDSRFLLYAYLGPAFQQTIRERTVHGSTVNRIPLLDIGSFPIEVPSLETQRAIARILGALDDKIELNRKTNETLETMARALFKSWFEDQTERAEVTERIVSDLSLEGVLQVGDGYRAKNDEMAPSGLPFARAGNIDNGFNFDRADLLGQPGVTKAGDKVSRPFDVVFTSKGTVGRFAFVDSEMPRFVYSPQLCFWRSTRHDILDPFVLRQWMSSRWFLDQVDRVKGQTDMAEYVSLRDQRAMRFPLPTPEAQHQVSGQLRSLQTMIWKNEREATTLRQLRDALLPRLLSGELNALAGGGG